MRRVGVLAVGVSLMVLALGGVVLQSCGGNDDKRTRERCEICDGHVDEDCRRECRKFCLPTEPDCEGRCTRECDQCKKELSCQVCAGSCTGTVFRCAPVDEVITCEDGTFGEGPQAPEPTKSDTTPHPDPTATARPTGATHTPTPTGT